MADGLFSSLYKAAIPVNARLALEHFTGTTAPITEKDFTPEELNALRQAIADTQQGNIDREAVYRANLKKTKAEYEQNPEYRYYPSPTKDSPTAQTAKPVPYSEWLKEQQQAVASFEKTRGKTSIGYGSYDIQSGDRAAAVGHNLWNNIIQSYTDPAYVMASTIGSANYFDKKGQTPYLEDSYKFVLHPEAYGDTSNLSDWEVLNKFKNHPAALLEIMAARHAPQQRPVKINLPTQSPTNIQYRDPFGDSTK